MRDSQRFAVFIICFMMGFVIALLLQFLYDQSIILPDLIEGTITLRAFQFLSLLLWGILGGFLASQ